MVDYQDIWNENAPYRHEKIRTRENASEDSRELRKMLNKETGSNFFNKYGKYMPLGAVFHLEDKYELENVVKEIRSDIQKEGKAEDMDNEFDSRIKDYKKLSNRVKRELKKSLAMIYTVGVLMIPVTGATNVLINYLSKDLQDLTPKKQIETTQSDSTYSNLEKSTFVY